MQYTALSQAMLRLSRRCLSSKRFFSREAPVELVTFDAYETLIAPSRTSAEWYLEVLMNTCGTRISPPEVSTFYRNFINSFSNMSAIHRCYGASSNMTCISWWHHVIHNTIRSTLTPQENRIVPASQITHMAKILYYDIFNTDKGWKLSPHGHEVISKLAQYRDNNNGPKLAIIISIIGWNTFWQMKIEHLFDTIVVSYDVKCEKPDRQIFDECKRRLNIKSNDVIHVGNSLKHDVLAACKLDWIAVHYNPSGALSDNIKRESTDEDGVYLCHQDDHEWVEVKCLSQVAKLVIE